MHSFQVEIDAMREAQQKLAVYRDALERYRDTAAGLTNSVPRMASGIHDPVADKLHDVFFDRAHTQAGVAKVLDDYLRELAKIQQAIAVNLGAYTAAEQEAVARYRTMPGEAR